MSDYGWLRVDADEFQFLIVEHGSGTLEVDLGVGLGLVDTVPGTPAWLVVHTGAHWGPVHVAWKLRNDEPAVDHAWQEIVEFSVSCASGLRLQTLDGTAGPLILDRAGVYRLRLSVSGRAAGFERYSSARGSKILEQYLIELWPAPASSARALKVVEPINVVEPVIESEVAGLAAAARIDADVNRALGARLLTGQTSALTVSHIFTATRRKLFSQFAQLDLWLANGGSGGQPSRDENGGVHGGYICTGSVLGGTRGGIIWGEIIDFDSPAFVESTWNWRTPYSSSSTSWDLWASLLSSPAVLRVDLHQRRASSVTTTTVTINHSRIPIEWRDDLTQFWQWKLEQGDKLHNLGHY